MASERAAIRQLLEQLYQQRRLADLRVAGKERQVAASEHSLPHPWDIRLGAARELTRGYRVPRRRHRRWCARFSVAVRGDARVRLPVARRPGDARQLGRWQRLFAPRVEPFEHDQDFVSFEPKLAPQQACSSNHSVVTLADRNRATERLSERLRSVAVS